jgi:hypothetical protein
MKLRFPPTRYRVVRDDFAGYEAQFRPWCSLAWMQCCDRSGGAGVNTSDTIAGARKACADHAKRRRNPNPVGQVVAQFSARELEAKQ